MKRTLFLMALEMGLLSCQNDSVMQLPDTEIPSSDSEMYYTTEQIASVSISIDEGVARIGFLESAVFCCLTLSRSRADAYLHRLEEAKAAHVFLKFFLFADFEEIASAETVDTFRKRLLPQVELRSRSLLRFILPYEAFVVICHIKNDGYFPIDYIGNGCMARTQEIAHLVNQAGYQCEKYFIFSETCDGVLLAYSAKGLCCASWHWHVAVKVKVVYYVRDLENFKQFIFEKIIGSSFFDRSVRIYGWETTCTNRKATANNCLQKYSTIWIRKTRPCYVYEALMDKVFVET